MSSLSLRSTNAAEGLVPEPASQVELACLIGGLMRGVRDALHASAGLLLRPESGEENRSTWDTQSAADGVITDSESAIARPPAVPIDISFYVATVIYRWLPVRDESDRGPALPRGPLLPSLCMKSVSRGISQS